MDADAMYKEWVSEPTPDSRSRHTRRARRADNWHDRDGFYALARHLYRSASARSEHYSPLPGDQRITRIMRTVAHQAARGAACAARARGRARAHERLANSHHSDAIAAYVAALLDPATCEPPDQPELAELEREPGWSIDAASGRPEPALSGSTSPRAPTAPGAFVAA